MLLSAVQCRVWVARGGAREAPPVESRAPAGAVGPHVSHKPCNCENPYLWKFDFVNLWIRDFWYLCVCKHVTCVLAFALAPLRVISSDDDDDSDDRKWQKWWWRWCCWCHHPLIDFFKGELFSTKVILLRDLFPECLWNPRIAMVENWTVVKTTCPWQEKKRD